MDMMIEKGYFNCKPCYCYSNHEYHIKRIVTSDYEQSFFPSFTPKRNATIPCLDYRCEESPRLARWKWYGQGKNRDGKRRYTLRI